MYKHVITIISKTPVVDRVAAASSSQAAVKACKEQLQQLDNNVHTKAEAAQQDVERPLVLDPFAEFRL
jgi:hypothetical protein